MITHSKMSINKDLILSLIGKTNPIIFDIGAHHGEDSEEFTRTFREESLFLFEPDPRCLAKIKAHKKKWNIFEGVVSDVDGVVDFFRSNGTENKYKNWDGSGSTAQPKEVLSYFPAITFEETIAVNSITLNSFVDKNNISLIDLIWADIQGGEEKMIRGGSEVFPNKVRVLYTEYCEKELYLGAPPMKRVLELLPDFDLLGVYEECEICRCMLLRNKRI